MTENPSKSLAYHEVRVLKLKRMSSKRTHFPPLYTIPLRVTAQGSYTFIIMCIIYCLTHVYRGLESRSGHGCVWAIYLCPCCPEDRGLATY